MTNQIGQILTQLWFQSRFSSYFYQSVHIIETGQIPSLGLIDFANRLTLYVNPEFVEGLDRDSMIGLLVHEMLHVVFQHNHRSLNVSDLYLQNLAQDMVVNTYIHGQQKTFFSKTDSYSAEIPNLVLPNGLPVVPDDFFTDTQINDPSWEDVFSWLKLPKNKKKLHELSSSMDGNQPDNPLKKFVNQLSQMTQEMENPLAMPEIESDPMQKTMFKDHVALIFQDHDFNQIPTGVHLLHNSDMNLSLDAKKRNWLYFAQKDELCQEERAYQDLKGIIQKIRQVDATSWKNVLKSIIDYRAQSSEWGYTTHRFNRRFFSQGIYAPGRYYKEMQSLTIAVDVSGSMIMNPQDIETAFGAVEEILHKYRIYLVCIDETVFIPEKKGDMFEANRNTSIPYIYQKGDWRYIRTGAKGTTFFAPLFNSFMRGHNEMLIVITDGYIYDLENLKNYAPTLWLIPEKRTAPFDPPFGTVLPINVIK